MEDTLMTTTLKNSQKKPFFVWILIILEIFLGIGAIVSGAMLMISPDGSMIQLPLDFLQGSPFASFFIPGLILFVFVGIYPLCISFSLCKKPAWTWPDVINPFKKYHWSWAGALASGMIVLIWLSVELIWVGYSVLHTIYYIWGGLIILLALLPEVQRYLQRE